MTWDRAFLLVCVMGTALALAYASVRVYESLTDNCTGWTPCRKVDWTRS